VTPRKNYSKSFKGSRLNNDHITLSQCSKHSTSARTKAKFQDNKRIESEGGSKKLGHKTRTRSNL